MKCDKCQAELYCSEDCRMADEHVHKTLCDSWLSKEVQQPPSPGARRVIVLEEREPIVRFVWASVSKPGEAEFEIPSLRHCRMASPGDYGSPRACDFKRWEYNPIRQRKFDDVSILFWFCDNALDKRFFQPNAAAEKFFPETKNTSQGSVWPGPVLVSRNDNHTGRMLDMNIRDMREVVDWLIKFSQRPGNKLGLQVEVLPNVGWMDRLMELMQEENN